MSKTYAIADLHGRYDLLLAAIDRIEASPSGGTVVFTGDYIDRGPESRQIIERLMAGPSDPSRWNWVCLQGNHEEIMLTCHLAKGMTSQWWIPNGGGATLMSYGAKDGESILDAWERVPQGHIGWLKGLPLLHVDEHRVFVHAGVDETLELDDQPAKVLQWHRYEREYPHGYRGKHVVHGHEQYEDGPVLHDGRTDLDTLAWWTGRLVIGVFDDDKAGGPVELLELKRAAIAELRAAA